MKQITFSMLSVAMMLLIGSAKAGAQVHGFGGYYDWTSKQMQADGIFRVDGNTGNKDKNWLPKISIDEDGLTDYLGVGKAITNWWRSTVYLNFQAKDKNITITKDYPVIAFKFMLPNDYIDESSESSLSVESWWQNPTSNTSQTTNNSIIDGFGFDKDGRVICGARKPGYTCTTSGSPMLDTDISKIGWESNLAKGKLTKLNDDGVYYVSRYMTINNVKRITDRFYVLPLRSEDKDEREFVGILNYDGAAIKGDDQFVLDKYGNIESVGLHFMFFAYKTISTANEAPQGKIKWIKSFKSVEDVEAQLCEANNWGNNEQEAKYSLTLGKAEMSTLVLPFDASLPEGIKAYTLNASGNQITATPVSNIEKDKPVIVCGKAGTYEFSGTQTIESMFNERTLENGSMKGVYAKTEAAEGNYVLQKHGDNAPAFYKLTESSNKTINPYRAYLTVASDAREMKLVFDDNEVTGINNVGQEGKDKDKIVYNLSGQRLLKSVKGLQIINGKKEIIK